MNPVAEIEKAIGEQVWTCHICGCLRPDSKISVYSYDISLAYGLPAGTMKRNVRYCNDKPECKIA